MPRGALPPETVERHGYALSLLDDTTRAG